jgi:2-polyprenyl-6-methoxyphenol hydroxylase-like FAD-dependent oxidoreductase
MYDAIVVGARCAGAATARLLARAGHKVLLLDRADFPSDTLSTQYIHQPGLARLHRWGLLDDVLATGAPSLTRVSFTLPGARLTGPAPTLGPITGGCAPRRYALDHLMVQAAVDSGVEFRPGTNVVDLRWENGRVTGVRHGTRHGPTASERAHLVIGADGRNSTVARLTRARYLRQDSRLSRTYYTYWSALPDQGLRTYSQQGVGTACVPTQDETTLIAVAFTRTLPADIDGDRQRAYRQMLRRASPELDQQFAAARQEDRLYCCADQPNFFRQPHGPGWALVGDAAHTKDPINARGITDAFTQSDMLVEQLGGPLDDTEQVEAALTTYALRLREEFTPAYEDTLLAARLDVDRYRAHMIENQHDPTFTDGCFRTFAGMR